MFFARVLQPTGGDCWRLKTMRLSTPTVLNVAQNMPILHASMSYFSHMTLKAEIEQKKNYGGGKLPRHIERVKVDADPHFCHLVGVVLQTEIAISFEKPQIRMWQGRQKGAQP